MEAQSEKPNSFPTYLPKPDETVLRWIGEHLKNSRGRKTTADVAKAAKVSTDEIESLEKGIIPQNLGQFRQILRRGYGRGFEDVLSKCYTAFKDRFNPTGKRSFDRDYYYALCLKNVGKKPPTALLVGGDPDNFLWAVPLRKLKKQVLSVELLELAPKRTKKHLGETPMSAHEGVEVIHVINGTVTMIIDTNSDSDDPQGRMLKAGDCIHFNSTSEHQVRNEGNTTSALLLIVRLS